jgi:tetratricopeptide (TPR) repeat protein
VKTLQNSGRIACVLASLALFIVACPLNVFAESDSAVVAADQVNSVFDVANEEYKAGNFENAITLYEGLLSGAPIEAADIHYNIGNASFKLGNYGGAIASYRRALRLAPRDRDIAANLNFVRDMTVDKMDRPRSAEFFREVFFFHHGLNAGEAEAILFCAYVAACVFGMGYLFRRAKALKWLALATLVVTLAAGASCAFRWYGTSNPDQAVIVADEAEIHTGPGRNYIVPFSLHDGAELKVRKSESEWFQIELPDGRRGWIEKPDIEII